MGRAYLVSRRLFYFPADPPSLSPQAAMEKADLADDCDACEDCMDASARLSAEDRANLPLPGQVSREIRGEGGMEQDGIQKL